MFYSYRLFRNWCNRFIGITNYINLNWYINTLVTNSYSNYPFFITSWSRSIRSGLPAISCIFWQFSVRINCTLSFFGCKVVVQANFNWFACFNYVNVTSYLSTITITVSYSYCSLLYTWSRSINWTIQSWCCTFW